MKNSKYTAIDKISKFLEGYSYKTVGTKDFEESIRRYGVLIEWKKDNKCSTINKNE